MSVPSDRMDSQQKGAEQNSHAAIHGGIQALAGAAAKMGSAKTEPHPALLDALASLHSKVDQLGQQGQGQGGADQYANMPDPSDWVENDPDGAANYAEAILAQLAHMLTDQSAAPAGAPMGDAGPVPPDVGGGGGPAY
jgi:hypothetical protein